jgi:tetratricopeptide (TPR) repeat protein
MCAEWVTGLMVEMLRKPDTLVAASRHCFRTLVLEMISLVLAASLLVASGGDAAAEKQLEAAIHREIVLGDLTGAMQQYREILAESDVSRPVAARALLQTGDCMEKLGRGEEAYNLYRKVENEYREQAAIVSLASTRLAAWVGPRNLKFEEGVRSGWFVPSLPKDANYVAELRREGCRSRNACAVVMAPVNGPRPEGDLRQTFSAVAYRGKTVRLRAWLRLEQFFSTTAGGLRFPDAEDRGQLWLRVERANHATGFSDNMDDRPARSSDWTRCDIVGEIDADAKFISFGVMSHGGGRVWIDDVSFEVVSK